jgi:putative endonuclease
MKTTVQKGNDAERIAELHYAQKGFRTVSRNFRWERGELDLVVENGETLLFVEVKSRRSNWDHHAWSPLWREKLRRIRGSMGVFLDRHPQFRGLEKGIDIVFVTQGRVADVFEAV